MAAPKNIPDSPFAADDGTADPRLAEALAAHAKEPTAGNHAAVLAALRGARLLVPVVALLTEAETGSDGLRRDKTSEMAIPTLKGPGGRKALPAFTSTEALTRWDPEARPVAVPLHQAIQAAVSERADTLALDIAGPAPYELSGPALLAAAEGRDSADPLTDPAVREAVREVLAGDEAVRLAHLGPGGADADGTLALVLEPGTQEQTAEAAQRIARALASHEALRARLGRGMTLALLPPEAAARLTGEPIYER
ncbi:SseB family protein [Streptomyces sp. A7024]|uniref:SseB family protein n=1 Tax=Streptomyces coryli TaxID=1128680 RepID=A0A6G4TYV8_9ACTN|nr:SseB family protein [Streptomyces coryli]